MGSPVEADLNAVSDLNKRKNSSSMSFKGYRLPYIKPQMASLSKDKQAEILKE